MKVFARAVLFYQCFDYFNYNFVVGNPDFPIFGLLEFEQTRSLSKNIKKKQESMHLIMAGVPGQSQGVCWKKNTRHLNGTSGTLKNKKFRNREKEPKTSERCSPLDIAHL